MLNQLKYELQHIIRGNGEESESNLISTIAYHLGRSQIAGSKATNTKQYKAEEISYLNAWLETRLSISQ